MPSFVVELRIAGSTRMSASLRVPELVERVEQAESERRKWAVKSVSDDVGHWTLARAKSDEAFRRITNGKSPQISRCCSLQNPSRLHFCLHSHRFAHAS